MGGTSLVKILWVTKVVSPKEPSWLKISKNSRRMLSAWSMSFWVERHGLLSSWNCLVNHSRFRSSDQDGVVGLEVVDLRELIEGVVGASGAVMILMQAVSVGVCDAGQYEPYLVPAGMTTGVGKVFITPAVSLPLGVVDTSEWCHGWRSVISMKEESPWMTPSPCGIMCWATAAT